MINRRHFLHRSTLLAGGALCLYRLPLHASTPDAHENRFVFVLLRGAMDGLNTLVPYADPAYHRLRESIALAAPGGAESAIRLDADFALHPALAGFADRFREGQLLAFPAIASPYRERSHFDGQNVLENGGLLPYQQRDGWLNRALASLPSADGYGGLAVGGAVPQSLQGDIAVESWSPNVLPEASDDIYRRLEDLYAGDPELAMQMQSLAKTRAQVSGMEMEGGRAGALQAFTDICDAAGKLLASPNGAQLATLELGGWDTHAGQGAETGRLANQLRALDAGLDRLRLQLGARWQQTAVLVMTEFGRTARVNGTGGTDHGTASAAFLLGGAVNGGRIVGDWPGLGERDLFEGRDLRPTLDSRAVAKGVLAGLLPLDEAALAERVFPDSAAVSPIGELLRG